MLTIVETTEFTKLWPDYWTAEQFGEFCAWLARNPISRRCRPRIGWLSQGALGVAGCR
jgi:hypothetical protein